MTSDLEGARKLLKQLIAEGQDFFASISPFDDETIPFGTQDADFYWAKLSDESRSLSFTLSARLMEVVKSIGEALRYSTIVSEADTRDLGLWTKSLRASLRLRQYRFWETEVLHDEGMVLGVQPSGQSDTTPVKPSVAYNTFDADTINLLTLIQLLDVSPDLSTRRWNPNPQATSSYEPDTAFVMMHIDPEKPALVDVYGAIKECFGKFGIAARGAHEIEHEDVITSKITERIRVSEFLFADLSYERPSVYYEIGYAHALKRKVIMYREKGTRLHFDLAAYNCPEFENITELKRLLTGRLEQVTNRKPASDVSV